MARTTRTTETRTGPRGAGPIVRLWIAGAFADLDPEVAPLVVPILQYVRRSYRPDGRGGTATSIQRVPVYQFDREGRLMFFAGHVPRVKAVLEHHGVRVEVVEGHPPRPRIQPGDIRPGGLDPDALAVVETLVRTRRGQIAVPGRDDRVALVAHLARALPGAGITVLFASRDQAGDFCHCLRRHASEPVLLVLRGFYRAEVRLRVCTFGSFDPSAADLVIFGEATDALHSKGRKLLPHLLNQKIFGFAEPEVQLGARERLLLEGFLGPVVAEWPSRGARLADVHVRLVETPWSPAPGPGSVLERKRARWADDRRNAALAELAEGLADDRRGPLERHGLFLDDEVARSEDEPSRRRVAILVESPEHGRQLSKLLPGWSLRTVVESAQNGRDAGPVLDRTIVTLVRAHSLGQLDVDVLIRADGSSGPLDLPGFPPRRSGSPGRPALLLDLGDDFDPEAEAATRARLRDYADRGWEVRAAARWDAIEPAPAPRKPRARRGRKRRGKA
jgi:hypothetical protein